LFFTCFSLHFSRQWPFFLLPDNLRVLVQLGTHLPPASKCCPVGTFRIVHCPVGHHEPEGTATLSPVQTCFNLKGLREVVKPLAKAKSEKVTHHFVFVWAKWPPFFRRIWFLAIALQQLLCFATAAYWPPQWSPFFACSPAPSTETSGGHRKRLSSFSLTISAHDP